MADNALNIGDIVDCTVEQIMPYGAFVRINKFGRKGMIHISELSYNFVKDINDVLKLQDEIKAKIIRIDEKGRIDLSIKQASEPPVIQAKPQRHLTPVNHEFRQPRENPRVFHDFRELAADENNNFTPSPDESDSFEKKMALFLKTSEAKITDLNTRNSTRSGRSKRRPDKREYQ